MICQHAECEASLYCVNIDTQGDLLCVCVCASCREPWLVFTDQHKKHEYGIPFRKLHNECRWTRNMRNVHGIILDKFTSLPTSFEFTCPYCVDSAKKRAPF